MRTMILFKTKYGSSSQYAAWLAEELQCKAEQIGNVKLSGLLAYDVLVYVGGLYAGSVNGFKQISRHLDVLQDKQLLLCMVGMTNPAEQEKYDQAFLQNVPEPYRGRVKPFALHGNQLFSKMSGFHRLMMKMPKAMAEKIPLEQRTEDDKRLLETFGQDVRFAKRENLHEILAYIRGLAIAE